MIKNKKGQALSIIYFFAIMIAVFIVSFVMMIMVDRIVTPFQSGVGNVSSNAGSVVSHIKSSFVTWWDWAIMILLFANIIVIFMSAFFIDIHPSFFLIYIFACLFLVIFGYTMLSSLQEIQDKLESQLTSGTWLSIMPMTNWVVNNFNIVMLGIIVLSGIVMYAKFKYFGSRDY
jgi:uncharacterized membrane protein YfcA